MMEMSEAELDEYARVLGVKLGKLRGQAAKVDAICKRRERVARIDVLGITVEVPVRALHDKRVTDRLDGRPKSDAELESILRDIVGEGQMAAIEERCTDDDGLVDVEAYGLALTKIVTSKELKNF